MKIVFEAKPFKFEYDAVLEHMVQELAAASTMTIQAIIDKCTRAGFDGRAFATEIGITAYGRNTTVAIADRLAIWRHRGRTCADAQAVTPI